MADGGAETGLSSAEAARRLKRLGPPPETSSRSASSIVAANVFTLFNLILGSFFIVVLALGLFADALFGLIAIVNSYIGIRQETKAKEVLDQLAVLVAPKAKVIRDGRLGELTAEEVVPGDVVRVEPGSVDPAVVAARGQEAAFALWLADRVDAVAVLADDRPQPRAEARRDGVGEPIRPRHGDAQRRPDPAVRAVGRDEVAG